jgi:putative transposase
LARPSPARRRSPSPTAKPPRSPPKWQTRYPTAVTCVTGDLASLTVHLRFPAEHWPRIRHSNLIERTFGETRRRTKVIGRLPGEITYLSLCGGAGPGQPRLAWPHHDPQGLRLLQDLRRQLLHPPTPEEVIDQAVTAAS